MDVYRYIEYKYFKEIVEKKSLRFVNPLVEWKTADQNEGFLFNLARTSPQELSQSLEKSNPKTKKGILSQLKQGGIFQEEDTEPDWFAMRCQSWCKTRNSPAMWSHYSLNNTAVCITVDLSDLVSLSLNNYKVEAFEVQYRDNLDVNNELSRVYKEPGIFTFSRVLEPKCFEYEDEYRLYISFLDSTGHKKCKENEVFVPITADIKSFIKDVLPDPAMNASLKREIKGYCISKGLHYSLK